MTTRSASQELALAVYLEELAEGRRVLWIGDTARYAPERLSRRARSLRALDPSGARSEGGRRGRYRVSPLRPGTISFKPASFDLVVVPDLAAVGLADEGRIDELREVLTEDGHLVAGTADRDSSLDYEGLYDLLTTRFEPVRMLGLVDFRGYSIVDFDAAAREGEVAVDGSLTEEGDRRVLRFFAIGGSATDTHGDAHFIVEVPGAEVEPAPEREPYRDDRDDDRLRILEERLADRQAETDAANEHAEALERALAARSSEIESLRDDIDRAERFRDELAELRRSREQLEDERRDLERQLAEARREVKKAAAKQLSMDLPTAPKEESGPDPEYVRLEAALSERAKAAIQLETEIERRGVLVRDLVEQIRDLRRTGPTPEVRELIHSRDAAVERALEAESARAEASFRIDELNTQLRTNGSASHSAITSSGLHVNVSHAPEEVSELRALRSHVAELRDQVAREVTRANEAEQTAARERDRATALERMREERDRVPLPITPASEAERRLAQQVGELSAQLLLCRDRAETMSSQRDQSRAETLRLTALVGSLEDRAEGARRGFAVRIAELTDEIEGLRAPAEARPSAAMQGELDSARLEVSSLRGERDGLRARLTDRERALATLRAKALPDREVLRAELDVMRHGEAQLSMHAAEAEERIHAAGTRVRDLSATIAARDALVSRLQIDLADEERKHRLSDERLQNLEGENRRLREAVVDASERVGDAERDARRATVLEAELARSETQRKVMEGELEAKAALEGQSEAREAAEQKARSLDRELNATRERFRDLESRLLSVSTAAEIALMSRNGSQETLGVVRELLARAVESLDGEAPLRTGETTLTGLDLEGESGEDTLVRSLMAQLEERDERIASLNKRFETSGPDTAEIAMLHARIAKLSEDLEHEREGRRRLAQPDDAQPISSEALLAKESELTDLRERLRDIERDLRGLRGAVADARGGLEDLLSTASHTDPEMADRLGSLLRTLGSRT